MSAKRVGQILRDAREEHRLTVRDVSKDTNIAVKFILALENEDYSQFPAETFAMGFLKTYSDYLKLDTAFILNLYRGEQMEESRAPLEELTKPTKPIVSSVKGDKGKLITIIAIIVLVIAFIIIGIFLDNMDDRSHNSSSSENTTPVVKTETKTSTSSTGIPKDINFISQSINDSKELPIILTPDKGVNLTVGSQHCKIFIKEVIESEKEQSKNTAVIGFNVYPDTYVHSFKITAGDTHTVSFKNQNLGSLQKEVIFKAQIVNDRSAKLMVSGGKDQSPEEHKASTEAPIQITLTFIKDSHADFIIDGQPWEHGKIKKNSVKKLEGKDRIEIKIADGSAVELVKNGQRVGKLGRPGQSVKKVYYKVPNPYDGTQYVIKESGD